MSREAFWVNTDDWHTAGEPFRIVDTSQLASEFDLTSRTVRERRLEVINTPGHALGTLRRALCHEPRGHADMYGGYVFPPDDNGAHLGVLFWHKDGFSTACGHGTIALGRWAVQKGLVKVPKDGQTDVVIDVPSGRVTAQVITTNHKITAVHFLNVPSYQMSSNVKVTLPSGQNLSVDLAWGGATYAFINVRSFIEKIHIVPEKNDTFISLGREVKRALGDRGRYNDLELYGVCFYEEISEDEEKIEQRNCVVFADGQIDRSPCGSGTAAKVAILHAQGRLKGGKRFVHRSIVGTAFEGSVVGDAYSPTEFPGCIPRVTGLAYKTGEGRWFIDPEDPTYPGFVFR